MDILNVKLETLLSYIKNTYDATTKFEQFADGRGSIDVIYGDHNEISIVSWNNEDERETKLMEYIFLNKV